jgi:hypothetical protein
VVPSEPAQEPVREPAQEPAQGLMDLGLWSSPAFHSELVQGRALTTMQMRRTHRRTGPPRSGRLGTARDGSGRLGTARDGTGRYGTARSGRSGRAGTGRDGGVGGGPDGVAERGSERIGGHNLHDVQLYSSKSPSAALSPGPTVRQ